MFHVFQSTHPSGVRPEHRDKFAGSIKNFNPRTPVGCDSMPCMSAIAAGAFQSTHPSGVRLVKPCIPCGIVGISIHAPQWGATATTRTHIPRLSISIHAPQWGATYRRAGGRRAGQISIHAPQWGATRRSARPACRPAYFNPRTPVGCDMARPRRPHRPIVISIHAPQWGATIDQGSRTLHTKFQSTHPSGVRQDGNVVGETGHYLFQSTHPSGVRHPSHAIRPFRDNFNPRTPVGCDCPAFVIMRRTLIFQSTHPSGVRRYGASSAAYRGYFNPRTPVGCDSPTGVLVVGLDISIHAPQWGATTRSRCSRRWS